MAECQARGKQAVQDLSHLEGYCEDLAQMADVQLACGGKVYPCHSVTLSMQSPLLASMFASTSRDSWGAGLAAAFADCPYPELFLRLMYNPAVHAHLLEAVDRAGVLLEFAFLAHRLSCDSIMQVRCECSCLSGGVVWL